MRTTRIGLGALLCLALIGGCGKKAISSSTPAPESPQPAAAATPTPDPTAPTQAAESVDARQTMAEADKLLRAGSYDQAAARLLNLRISAAKFSVKDAAAYRDALQEAYSRALEAANRGDPKGRAALEMIRATRAR